jgi:nucleoside phosphorylase
MELACVTGAETLCCGIGPVEAGIATARALAVRRPAAILNVGIAGARTLAPGSIVVGEEAVYQDPRPLPGRDPVVVTSERPDRVLLASARRALPTAHVLPIATTACVGGARVDAEVEAMEGFAVLRAASAAGVPAIELRAISNRYDDARSDWRIDEALVSLGRAVAILLEAVRA